MTDTPPMKGGFLFYCSRRGYDLHEGPVRRMVTFLYDRLQVRDPDLTIDQWVDKVMREDDAIEVMFDAYREIRTGQDFDPDRHDVPALLQLDAGGIVVTRLEQEATSVVVTSLKDVPFQEERRAVSQREVEQINEDYDD